VSQTTVQTGEDKPKARRFEPPVSPTTQAFWDATREQRFLLQWCTDCQRAIFFPREVCPSCLGSSLAWKESVGRGRVYTFTVEHRPQNPNLVGPYTVALIDLEEGVRMMSNVIDCDPDQVTAGMEVGIAWEALSDGRHLPMFAPTDSTAPGGDR